MRNPLYRFIHKLPISVKSVLKNELSQEIYHRIDSAFIIADNTVHGRHFTKSIRSHDATFKTPSIESWKMVNRRLDSEVPLIKALQDEINQNSDIFYDVGANIGTFTCFVGQQAKKTLAFEPYAPNASILKKTSI